MMRTTCTAALLLAGLASASCAENARLDPAPVQDAGSRIPAPDSGVDAATDAAPDAQVPTEAGPVRRTVMTRSPFGNLEHTDNLLLDGDIEMSSGAGQTPWIALGMMGQTDLRLETGGRCRSGLRCIVLDNVVDSVLGYGVAAGDADLELSLWAQVPGADCNIVGVYLFPRMTMQITMFHQVQPESAQPDAQGWCRFHAIRNAMDESTGIYVETSLASGKRVVLDDAVLSRADGASPTARRSVPVSQTAHQRIVSRLAPVLRQRWVGPPPGPGGLDRPSRR